VASDFDFIPKLRVSATKFQSWTSAEALQNIEVSEMRKPARVALTPCPILSAWNDLSEWCQEMNLGSQS